jgi:hypothetical protein
MRKKNRNKGGEKGEGERAGDDVGHSSEDVDPKQDKDCKQPSKTDGGQLHLESATSSTATPMVSPKPPPADASLVQSFAALKVEGNVRHHTTQFQFSSETEEEMESTTKKETGYRESRQKHVDTTAEQIRLLDHGESPNAGDGGEDSDLLFTAATQAGKDFRKQLACVAFGKGRYYPLPKLALDDDMIKLREESFQGKTVGMLLDMWHQSEGKKTTVSTMIRRSGLMYDVVASLLDGGITIEKFLNHKIIALNAPIEVDVADSCFVDLATTRDLASVVDKISNDRTDRIAYLLGPSGIGKTVCALKQVATSGWADSELYTTLYVKISELDWFDWGGKEIAADLLDWIQRELKAQTTNLYDKNTKLRMKMAVVLDEAGSTGLGGFFENKGKIHSLYNRLCVVVERGFEFRLVVSGTGLTGRDLSSGKDVDKIRLGPWQIGDFKQVAEVQFQDLKIGAVDAIYRHPILSGLTTNARSAWFLLKAVSSEIFVVPKAIKHSLRSDWDERFEAGLPAIVNYVVDSYMGINGVNDLNPRERRLVAAWVFYEVEQSRVHNGPDPYLPKFPKLDDGLVRVANALINVNIDYDNTNKKVKLVDDAQPSVSLSAALTIVLFRMLNVPAAIVSNWTGRERIASLHVVRHQVLSYLNEYLDAMRQNEEVAQGTRLASANSPIEVLDQQLLRLKLTDCSKCVPHTNTSKLGEKSIEVPLFGRHEIWKNGDGSPFADVITDYMLVQVKDSIKDTCQVDLL